MVNQAAIQAHVAKGLGIAASKLGASCQQFRPVTALEPLSGAPHASLMATFSSDAALRKWTPPGWSKPMVSAMMDTTDVLAGDLILSPQGIYFIARFEPFEVPLAVLTNRVVTLSGAADEANGGSCPVGGEQLGYSTSGDTSQLVTLASGWPVSVVLKNKGQTPGTNLPGDVKAAEFEMLLPAIPGFEPVPGMTVTTDLGTVYTLAGVEPSQYGSRCLLSVRQV